MIRYLRSRPAPASPLLPVPPSSPSAAAPKKIDTSSWTNGSSKALPPAAPAPPLRALGATTVRQPMGLRGRELSESGSGGDSTIVSDYTDLVNALADSSVAEILLEAGTYDVTSTLTISRDVTLAADVSGTTVVLDAGDSTQVMFISGVTVQLIGLSITNGNSADVSPTAQARPHPIPWPPHGSSFQALPPRARRAREAACTSTTIRRRPLPTVQSTLTRPAP